MKHLSIFRAAARPQPASNHPQRPASLAAFLRLPALTLLAPLLWSAACAAAAAGEAAAPLEFARIQESCVVTAAIDFGPQSTWKQCRLERAGFISTIGLRDFYFAQYCLIKTGSKCDKQALLVFSNRAYRPEAELHLHRLDAPGTRYETPLVIGDASQNVLALSAIAPAKGQVQRQFFVWSDAAWMPVDGEAWRKDLPQQTREQVAARLPRGWMPDPQTMAWPLPACKPGRSGCAGAAPSELRFSVQGQQLMARLSVAGDGVSGPPAQPRSAP